MRNSFASRLNRCDTPKTVPCALKQPRNASYSALMKDLKLIPSLLTLVLIVSSAVGQGAETSATNDPLPRNEIAAALRPYTQTPGIAPAANDGKDLAQLPQRGGMPIPPQRGYYRGGYATPWMGNGNAGHMLIGAGIGFGIGATLGAIGGAHTGTSGGSAVLRGSLFALIGAAIGASHGGPYPFMHHRRFYRPSWPEDDEESTRRSHSKRPEGRAELSVPERPVAPLRIAAIP
jgi:hypothetical protein